MDGGVMKRLFAPLAALLLLLAGCTGRDRPAPRPAPSQPATSSPASAGPTASQPPTAPQPPATALPVGKSSASLTVDGRKRTYLLYRPATAKAGAPLVVVLHGAVGTGR